MFEAFLWNILNICFSKHSNSFHFRCCTIYPTNFITTNDVFYCLKSDWWPHFLWSEPQNSIACDQNLIQDLGMRLENLHIITWYLKINICVQHTTLILQMLLHCDIPFLSLVGREVLFQLTSPLVQPPELCTTITSR